MSDSRHTVRHMPDDVTFITVAEAAQTLRVDVRTVHRLIARGELPALKTHKGLRAPFLLRPGDVEELAARRAA